MKNQRGFTLIGLLLTMSVLSLIAVGAVHELRDYRERTAAKQYVDRVIYLAERLQLYNHYKTTTENLRPSKSWPAKLDNLMSDYAAAFWQQCSVAEQQSGKCQRPESTPWNVPVIYYTSWHQPYAELTIPYGSTGDMIKRWSAPLREQKKYPHTEMPNGDVKIRVDYLTDAVAYRDFLKRDGSTTLTNDWDVGNKNIMNVTDISLVNSDGTMTSVASGLTRKHFSARHGAVIKKPSCPVGMIAKIQLANQGNVPTTVVNDYENFGPMMIKYVDLGSSGWRISAESVATRKSDGARGILREGVVAGETYCSK